MAKYSRQMTSWSTLRVLLALSFSLLRAFAAETNDATRFFLAVLALALSWWSSSART